MTLSISSPHEYQWLNSSPPSNSLSHSTLRQKWQCPGRHLDQSKIGTDQTYQPGIPQLAIKVNCDDLKQQSVNPGAAEKLVALVQDLLKPFMEIDNDQLLGLRDCFSIAARVGFGIQRDLRPWEFSFMHHGAKDIRLNDIAPVEPHTPAPFFAPKYDDIDNLASEKHV
ncbi:hypothetical protein IFR05_006749 [Cadophora sp. M221]|nr:hypothetical protein IFR05_006749 [Cadophora sp. M221]